MLKSKNNFVFSHFYPFDAIVIRFLVQYHKEYEIVTYGDSITEQFNWQTYLEDYYNESILNLGIGSSAFTNDGYSPAALDNKIF